MLIITSKRRFDVMITYLLRTMFAGFVSIDLLYGLRFSHSFAGWAL